MKKKLINVISMLMASVSAVSLITACQGNNPEDLYPGKKLIYFGCYDGGWGRE